MEQPEAKKTIRVLALASFLHDIGSDMVFSVWPIFVTTVLGANMAVLGFIDGLGDAIVSISQAVSGYISDRIRKRKVFVWLGYLFGGIARVGYAAASTWHFLIPFRILDRSGKFRGSPRDTIVSEASTRENRGKNFGILRAMDNAGAVVGILIAAAFVGTLGYRKLFLLAAIPSLLTAILVFAFIREAKSTDTKIYRGIRLKDFSRNMKLFTFLGGIFAFASFSYSFFLVYAKNFGFGIGSIPLFYLIFTLAAALFSLPFGKLSDTIGRKKMLYASYGLWACTIMVFLASENFLGFALGFVLYGLHKAALDTAQKAFVAELAPKEFLASSLGGFQMITGLAALPASLIAGFLWDAIGNFAPFYLSLGLTFVSLIMLVFVKEPER